MFIEKIKIDGFRNLDNISINLDNISAIVSLNNYGKTNILHSIQFGSDFIKMPIEKRESCLRNIKFLPINQKTSNRNFYFEFQFITNNKGKEYTVNYKYEFEWAKNDSSGSKIKKEQLQVKENIPHGKFSALIKREDNNCLYKSSPTGRCDTKLKINDLQLSLDKLQYFDDLYYLNILETILKLRIGVHDFLDTSHSFDPFPFESLTDSGYDMEGGLEKNIERIIYKLKNEHQDRYELLVDSFRQLFPDIEFFETKEFNVEISEDSLLDIPQNIPFKISDKIYRINVKEKSNNQITNFDFLSNGTKRLFLLLTAAVIADLRNISLIAFEELENCIHPSLFQKLLVILDNIATDCRIIISSHSPFILQYLDLSKIYIGIPNEHRTAFFKRIKNTYRKTVLNNAASEGITVGDYLFDLLVDCEDEDSELIQYLEDK